MDHSSSSLGRAQVRALVALETKLGVPGKYAKLVLYALIFVALGSFVFATSSLLFDDEDEYGADGGGGMVSSSFGGGGGSSSAAVMAVDDDDEEEEGEGEGEGGEEEEEEAPKKKKKEKLRKGDDDDDDDGEEEGGEGASFPLSVDTSEKYKASQLKKYQERDKQLMKFFSKFRKESEYAAHFKELADVYSDIGMMKQVTLGKTYEHKPVVAYELGKGQRTLLLVAGERGNEWAGSMALTYFATRLLQKYSLTPQVSAILNDLTLRIVPVVNPDGYAYHKQDWHMNRAPEGGGSKKKGVDVSLDFASSSQLETQAVTKYALEHKQDTFAFVNVKSSASGGAVSLPKQAVCAATEEDQMGLAQRIAQAMGKGGKFKYPIRTADPPPGDGDAVMDSPGFAFSKLGLGLSFTLEAKEAAKDDILATSQNVTMGLLELAKFVLNDFPATKNLFGGGGAVPCVSGGSSARSKPRKQQQQQEEDEEDGGEEEVEEAEEEEEDHSRSFKEAKPAASSASSDDDVEISLQLANRKARKIQPPPANPDDTFLYFAYGPDMLYDVLLKAGLTSAWKVSNAKLSGYTFDYTYHSNKKWKSGIADMVKSPHSAMYGVVWRLDLAQMPVLLAWQSASSAETSPVAQKLVSVESATGEVFTCVSFYVRKKMRGEDVLEKYHRFNPSRQYRNCVLRGAKSNKLPLDYIEHRLKSRTLGPLFTDKVGSFSHRNEQIGTVCDPLSDVAR